MALFLPTGQKFRFKGRDAIAKARACAAELQDDCIRVGSEIEMTAPREMTFTPIEGAGYHLTPLAAHKIYHATPGVGSKLRMVDFR